MIIEAQQPTRRRVPAVVLDRAEVLKVAAEMAQEAGVKKLVLVHMGPNLSAREPFEDVQTDMQRIYQGEIVFSEELLKIDL